MEIELNTKGIILAGGAGTRLYPITSLYSKQLVAIYDKPMIYYPLSTLIMAGIKEILIISNAETLPYYKKLFADGTHLGLKISYALQHAPNGIAESFIIGQDFIGRDNVVLILGDNIFYGSLNFLRSAVKSNENATIFGYYVKQPESYGVVEFDKGGNAISIEEKPQNPKSHYAVPGLYVYSNEVVNISKSIRPSARGELEITDVNRVFLNNNKLKVEKLGRGIAWLDSGTPDSLLDASNFIASVEARQGLKIGCIEESSFRAGFLDKKGLQSAIDRIPKSDYRSYLEAILKEEE